MAFTGFNLIPAILIQFQLRLLKPVEHREPLPDEVKAHAFTLMQLRDEPTSLNSLPLKYGGSPPVSRDGGNHPGVLQFLNELPVESCGFAQFVHIKQGGFGVHPNGPNDRGVASWSCSHVLSSILQ